MGASGLARQHERGPYIRRNRYILSIVIMTLELVAQVVRSDYSVINVGIQYSSVRFECHYFAGFCFVGKFAN